MFRFLIFKQFVKPHVEFVSKKPCVKLLYYKIFDFFVTYILYIGCSESGFLSGSKSCSKSGSKSSSEGLENSSE